VARILLIGATGQLGSDLREALPSDGLAALARRDLDVTDGAAIERALEVHAPAWVIDTAAFHRVDDIETDPGARAQALAVNVVAADHLARACARRAIRLVYLSTDYVFGDVGRGPHAEDAPVAPQSVYALSKLAGELLVRAADPRHLVIRSSGLYGVAGSSGKGGNFVETMLRLAREGRPLRVVDDQVLTPTYTRDLAGAVARLIERDPPGGIFHLTNAGACSWFEFARRIFALCGLAPDLAPTTSAAFAAPARRPANSVLLNARAAALGLPPLRPWPEALLAYLRAKRHVPA
jgi:dTDP-4-dehydrorhamnose reductase